MGQGSASCPVVQIREKCSIRADAAFVAKCVESGPLSDPMPFCTVHHEELQGVALTEGSIFEVGFLGVISSYCFRNLPASWALPFRMLQRVPHSGRFHWWRRCASPSLSIVLREPDRFPKKRLCALGPARSSSVCPNCKCYQMTPLRECKMNYSNCTRSII